LRLQLRATGQAPAIEHSERALLVDTLQPTDFLYSDSRVLKTVVVTSTVLERMNSSANCEPTGQKQAKPTDNVPTYLKSQAVMVVSLSKQAANLHIERIAMKATRTLTVYLLSLGLAISAFGGATTSATTAPKHAKFAQKQASQTEKQQEKSEKAAFKQHLKSERAACKANPNRVACHDLKQRQKMEKRDFKAEEKSEKRGFKKDHKETKHGFKANKK